MDPNLPTAAPYQSAQVALPTSNPYASEPLNSMVKNLRHFIILSQNVENFLITRCLSFRQLHRFFSRSF
jgi:hypothetical protein